MTLGKGSPLADRLRTSSEYFDLNLSRFDQPRCRAKRRKRERSIGGSRSNDSFNCIAQVKSETHSSLLLRPWARYSGENLTLYVKGCPLLSALHLIILPLGIRSIRGLSTWTPCSVRSFIRPPSLLLASDETFLALPRSRGRLCWHGTHISKCTFVIVGESP